MAMLMIFSYDYIHLLKYDESFIHIFSVGGSCGQGSDHCYSAFEQ